MACSTTDTQPVNLEIIINPLTGTETGQMVACGYSDKAPFIGDDGLIHIFANFDVNFDVSVSDSFSISCAPSVPFLTVPVTTSV